ncbi:MAG: transglycosylase domain-containing protein [Firmicutes bacterium]|nr:transglycosylase domain-containing protein [Bacillota bacterium]
MKKIIKLCILGLLTVITVIFGVITGMGYKLYCDALDNKPLSQAVSEIQGKADYTELDELPQIYLDAVLAVEDHRFYSHFGIDLIASARAAWNDILAGAFVEGGSTITQQLAKNMFFSQKKTLLRKAAEAFMAVRIEREYDKEQILELYVNSIYFGSGYYSVKDACNGYFGIEPKEMDDYQCTLLAGIPNAPSVYAPTENPDLAQQRQRQVVDKMVKYGYLDEEGEKAVWESASADFLQPDLQIAA